MKEGDELSRAIEQVSRLTQDRDRVFRGEHVSTVYVKCPACGVWEGAEHRESCPVLSGAMPYEPIMPRWVTRRFDRVKAHRDMLSDPPLLMVERGVE